MLIEEQTACGAYEAAIVNAQRYLTPMIWPKSLSPPDLELYAAIGIGAYGYSPV